MSFAKGWLWKMWVWKNFNYFLNLKKKKRFPWQKIRNLYLHKLKYVLNNITPSSASHVSTTTTTTAPTSLSPTSILGTSLKSDFENQTPFNSSSSFYMFMQNSNTTDLNNVKLIKDRLIERMESFTRCVCFFLF